MEVDWVIVRLMYLKFLWILGHQISANDWGYSLATGFAEERIHTGRKHPLDRRRQRIVTLSKRAR